MIVLISGKDSYRRKKRFKEIVDQFKDKYGVSGFRSFDTSVDDVMKIVDFIVGRSLFDPLCMAAVDIDVEEITPEELGLMAKSLKRAASDREMTVLLSSESDPTAELGLEKSDIFSSWDFEPLEDKELSAFIAKEALSSGIKLSSTDIRSLISSFNGDLWAISTEIEKMSFSGSSVVTDNYSGLNYFTVANSFKSGRNPGERLAALEILLTKLKEDPARVFNGLAYSVPRGAVPETWFQMMADYDIAVKSGKMDYTEALVDMATR